MKDDRSSRDVRVVAVKGTLGAPTAMAAIRVGQWSGFR